MSGRLYDTLAWKRLRRLKLARDPLCEECLTLGRHVAATEVDHVLSVSKGGAALDIANLASMCRPCHSRKTADMDGAFGRAPRDRRRVRGCTVDGAPRDPDHPWNSGAESRDREGQPPTPPRHGTFREF